MPPSLIFAGPDGVGKQRTAVAVAQTLNCPHTQAARLNSIPTGAEGPGLAPETETLPVDACGECAVCRRIERGIFPDVMLVGPGETGAIKIEQVRPVVGETTFRPFEGRRRVVIVDEAERMTPDAQDALLKSLEEPPPHSVFILVSARPDALVPTIRSRCSRLRFGPLAPSEIARALEQVHGMAGETSRRLAALAGGSLGRAVSLAGGDEDGARGAALKLLANLAAVRDARGRLASARELLAAGGRGPASGADREALADIIRALAVIVRDLVVCSTRAPSHALANLDLTSQLEGLSRSYGRDRALRAFVAADRALGALRRNASPKIVADWLALQL